MLGFGGSRVGNLYSELPEADAVAALRQGHDLGIRYFDTAPLYGGGLGECRLARALDGHERTDVVLSTKVGQLAALEGGGEARSGFRVVRDYRRASVLRSIDESLARLETDRLDIVLLHDPPRPDDTAPGEQASFRTAIEEGFAALIELKAAGLVGAIGVGVNDHRVVDACLAHADLDVVLLAGRYTLLEHGCLETTMATCLRRDIGVIVGAPFNAGLLARGPVPGARFFDRPPPPEMLDKARRIARICAADDVPLAAAALRFPLAHPAVASVLPGIGSAARAKEIARLFACPIPPTLWSELKRAGLLHADAPAAP